VADSKRTISLVIEARNQADQALKSLANSLLSIKGLTITAGAAFGAFSLGLEEAVRRAAKQEDADVRLAIALASIGKNTAAARQQFSEFASTLEQATGVSDEAIQGVMTMLIQLGRVGPEQLERVTRATLDLAAVTGRDLTGAAELMARAAQGQTQSLSRFGIVLDEAIPRSQKFAALLNLIEQNMGGTAETVGQTLSKSLERVTNDFDNLMQEVGKSIIESGAFRALVELISEALQGATRFVKEHEGSYRSLWQTMGTGILMLARMAVQLVVWETELIQSNLRIAELIAKLGVLASLGPFVLSKVFGIGKGEAKAFMHAAVEAVAFLEKIDSGVGKMGVAGEDVIARIEKLLAALKTTSGGVAGDIGKIGRALGEAKGPAAELDQILKDLGTSTLKDLQVQSGQVDQALTQLQAALESGAITPNQFDAILESLMDMADKLPSWTDDMSRAFIAPVHHLTDMQRLLNEIQASLEGAVSDGAVRLGDTFVDVAMGAKVSWGNLFRQILADIVKAIVRALILRAIMTLFGGGGGAAAGAAAGTVEAASGGEIVGGTAMRDSVAALLMPGEVVLPQRLRQDFQAIANLGGQLRHSSRAGTGAGERPGLLGAFHILPRRDDRDVAEIIEGITRLVERRGYRLVASEVLA